jgi:5-methylcytosine-specific restriction endonuclease McrA
MPIKKENVKRYPADWKSIRAAILARAQYRCEGSPAYPECRAANGEPHPVTGSTVVLTIGHLDHTPEHNEPANLRAWCQRCHCTYDSAHHAETAAETRRKKREWNQLPLPGVKAP